MPKLKRRIFKAAIEAKDAALKICRRLCSYQDGGILLVTGIIQFVHGILEDSWSGKLLSMILGAITVIGGIAVLAHPILGLTVLALVLAIFFVIEGIWKVIASFSFRAATGWVAMLFSGIIGLLLGYMIWSQWPVSGLWAVGILVGVDLLTTGISMIAFSVTIRGLQRAVEEGEGAAPA